MTFFVRILAILFIGMIFSVSAAAEDDLDSLRRRLAEVEAEQARSQATIEALRSAIEQLGRKAEGDRLAEQPVEETRDVVTEAPAGSDLPSAATAR